MEADDDGPTAWFEQVGQPGQQGIQSPQLIVDSDPQGLKDPGGRVDRSPLAGNAPADDLGELAGRFDRLGPPGFDNPSGDPATVPFFPKLIKEVRQFLFRPGPNNLGRREFLFRVESHVQGAFPGEAKAAIRPGQLIRREPEVQQEPVHRFQPQAFENLQGLVVRGMNQGDGQSFGRGFGQGEHLGVAIEPDHPACRTQLPGQCRRMSSRPHGSINENLPLRRLEPVHHLIQQDGPMNRTRRRFLVDHGRLNDGKSGRIKSNSFHSIRSATTKDWTCQGLYPTRPTCQGRLDRHLTRFKNESFLIDRHQTARNGVESGLPSLTLEKATGVTFASILRFVRGDHSLRII